MHCNRIFKGMLITTLCSALLFSGCAKEVGVPDEPQSQAEVTSEVEEVADANTMADKNPLTGQVMDASLLGKRPLSFIINNSPKAWPQAGISSADVVYEWPYEGGSTRLMAVMMDYTQAEAIGPLRSARHDFVELSLPLHTVFVHWGGSKPGYASINSHEIDNIDGMASLSCFYRDQERLSRVDLEHTGMVDTAELQSVLTKRESINLNLDIDPIFNFNLTDEALTFSDTDAYEIGLDMNSEVYCTFVYDETAQTYEKYEYDMQQIDANNDQPVALDNVFVLYANITQYDSENVWRDMKLEEGGTGYYVTRGTKTPINWSKEGDYAPIVYTTESGEDLEVNPGKTWIMMCDLDTETVWKAKDGTEAGTSDDSAAE